MTQPSVNLLLASDLHVDVGAYPLRDRINKALDDGAQIDAVVLAGDLCESDYLGGPVAYAQREVPSHLPVAFVPGNHDFYKGRYGTLVNQWLAQAKGSHVHVLVEEEMVVANPYREEIVLLGTPLWSNLASMGPLVESDLRRGIHRQISDFAVMLGSQGEAWNVQQMLAQFEKGQLFLEKGLSRAALADGRRRVVVTHFGPHRESIAPRWRGVDISAYFINHLPELVERADLWLHGHTHEACHYQVGEEPDRGLVVCHPRGYLVGTESKQALAYEPLLIEVPVNRIPWDRGIA